MNSVRRTLSTYFKSDVGNMDYVHYLSYLNEQGKITARSTLEICMILLTHIDELEKQTTIHEENFKMVHEIIAKLVTTQKAQVEVDPTAPSTFFNDLDPTAPSRELPKDPSIFNAYDSMPSYICDKCDFIAKSEFGLRTHKRSHDKEKVDANVVV